MTCPNWRLRVITAPERTRGELLSLPDQNGVPKRFELILPPLEGIQSRLERSDLTVKELEGPSFRKGIRRAQNSGPSTPRLVQVDREARKMPGLFRRDLLEGLDDILFGDLRQELTGPCKERLERSPEIQSALFGGLQIPLAWSRRMRLQRSLQILGQVVLEKRQPHARDCTRNA